MDILKLDWDSKFFGLDIHKYILTIEELDIAIAKFQRDNCQLAYFFIKNLVPKNQLLTLKHPYFLDDRVIYHKSLEDAYIINDGNIFDLHEDDYDNLINLAVQIGHKSRFKLDLGLSKKFEPLYSLWLKKSLSGELAQYALGHKNANEIASLITLTNTDNEGKVGLFGVNESSRGMGYAKSLLRFAEMKLKNDNVSRLIIPTQLKNQSARGFYEKMGYKVQSYETIIHIWRK